MGFQEAVQSCLSQYAKLSGRARRSEYWYFALFNGLLGAAISVLGTIILGETLAEGLSVLVSLALLCPGFGVFVRRMHDIGKSGWNFLFAAIPLVGWILLIVWCCQDSQPGANQYGPNPKGVGAPF